MGNHSATAIVCGDLNLLRCFAGSGVPLMVLSSQQGDPILYSRYCQQHRIIGSPATEPERAIDDLCRIGQTFTERPVLFYETDSMLLALSRYRDRLAPWFRFLLPPAELVEQLVDKIAFSALGQKHGFLLPKSITPRDLARPEDLGDHLTLPVVLKPGRHIGWFGASVIQENGGAPAKMLRADTMAEFLDLYPKVRSFTEDFLIQEYIPGGDDSIYSFHAYYDEHSRPLAYHAGRKIRTYPKDSGLSTYLELCKEPAVIDLGLALLKAINFVGPIKIDFKKDARRGKYYILEFNPRYTLWNYLGARSGINLPLIAYAHLTGHPPPPQTEYRTGLKWLAFENDLRAFLKCYRPAGDLTLSSYLLSLASRKVHDVFAWDDPVPFLVHSYQYSRHLLQRVTGKKSTSEGGVQHMGPE